MPAKKAAKKKSPGAKQPATTGKKAPKLEDWLRAVVRGQLAVVQAGLEAGIDPNTFVDDELPIVKAIEAGNLKVITTLLAGGARVDLVDEYGMTPLHHAALRTSKVEIVKVLVDAGSNPKAKSTKDHDLWAGGEKGMTPLEMARARPSPEKKVTDYLAKL